jgi:hypothetical protein
MSEDTFRIVDKIKVGTLSGPLRAEWERLVKAQREFAALQVRLLQELDVFNETLAAVFGQKLVHGPPNTDSDGGFRIEDNGDVFFDQCTCPVCQAAIHNLSVLETVEEMYKSELIPPQAIEDVRCRARVVDTKNKTSKRMRN